MNKSPGYGATVTAGSVVNVEGEDVLDRVDVSASPSSSGCSDMVILAKVKIFNGPAPTGTTLDAEVATTVAEGDDLDDLGSGDFEIENLTGAHPTNEQHVVAVVDFEPEMDRKTTACREVGTDTYNETVS